jgi:hypothetical protein
MTGGSLRNGRLDRPTSVRYPGRPQDHGARPAPKASARFAQRGYPEMPSGIGRRGLGPNGTFQPPAPRHGRAVSDQVGRPQCLPACFILHKDEPPTPWLHLNPTVGGIQAISGYLEIVEAASNPDLAGAIGADTVPRKPDSIGAPGYRSPEYNAAGPVAANDIAFNQVVGVSFAKRYTPSGIINYIIASAL